MFASLPFFGGVLRVALSHAAHLIAQALVVFFQPCELSSSHDVQCLFLTQRGFQASELSEQRIQILDHVGIFRKISMKLTKKLFFLFLKHTTFRLVSSSCMSSLVLFSLSVLFCDSN